MSNNSDTTAMNIRFVIGFYAAMAACGCAWLFFISGSPVPTLFPKEGSLPLACAAGLAFAIAIIALTPGLLRLSAPLRLLTQEIQGLLGNLSHSEILIIAIASGIGEEVLFRGAIQTSLGLFWTSVFFGLLHGLPGTRLAHWGGFAFVVGLGFGALQEYSGSVLPPAIAHFSINYWNLNRIVQNRLALNPPGD